MAFKTIADVIAAHGSKKRAGQKPFFSVNRNAGGYLGGDLVTLMDRPIMLEVEFDEEDVVLKFRKVAPGTPGAIIVKNRRVPLPEKIRELMGEESVMFKATGRYNVELRDDGWWYTTTKQTSE